MDLMDFGIEMETVKEEEYVRIPEYFITLNIKDFYDDERFTGQPHITETTEKSFNNGDKKIESTLMILNYDNDKAIRYNITMKSMDDLQKGIHSKSKLFTFIKSLFEAMGTPIEGNRIKQVNWESIRTFVNEQIEEMTVAAVTRCFTNGQGEEVSYNELKVVSVEKAD